MNQILVDKNILTVDVPQPKTKLAPLTSAETVVDGLGVSTLLNQENVEPPAKVEAQVKKMPVCDLTQFRVYSQEEIDAMDIQKLLMTLLQGAYLVQHESSRINSDLMQTFRRVLDVVVQKVAAQQGCVNWAIPAFLAAGLGGLSGLAGNHKMVVESLSGATKTLSDIMQQTDKAKETTPQAEQSALNMTLNAKEQDQSAKNKKEETLNELKALLNRLMDLCMRINS